MGEDWENDVHSHIKDVCPDCMSDMNRIVGGVQPLLDDLQRILDSICVL